MNPSNTYVELELTFLARTLPTELQNARPEKMVDVYVPATAAHPCLRIRRKGARYEITKKIPVDDRDSSRLSEQTIPLDEAEFTALCKASGKTVEKDRYNLMIEGHTAEVDVFTGELKGLVLIDFEFETEEAKQAFAAPDCCLADVTQEAFVAGGMLAGKKYADIQDELAKYKYQSLSL
jgi:CYTH domain-containing protein